MSSTASDLASIIPKLGKKSTAPALFKQVLIKNEEIMSLKLKHIEQLSRLEQEKAKQFKQLEQQTARIQQLEREVATLRSASSKTAAPTHSSGLFPSPMMSNSSCPASSSSSSGIPLSDQSSVQKSQFIFSSSSSSSSVSDLSSYSPPKSSLKVTTKEVQKFLNHVVAGEQDEAEAMLKKNSELALAKGTVTDHAKRTFENITGFQYAVWALDWHMWKMIRKYLPTQAAQEQARGFAEDSWVAEHGAHANWKKLIEAQQTLIDNWQVWDWEKVNDYWTQQIGGSQFLLPMHVLQEYNQPVRSFCPCPKFYLDYILTRSSVDLSEVGSWRAMYRGGSGKLVLCDYMPGYRFLPDGSLRADVWALCSLFTIRARQRAALVVELTKGIELEGSAPEPVRLDSKDVKESSEISKTSSSSAPSMSSSSSFSSASSSSSLSLSSSGTSSPDQSSIQRSPRSSLIFSSSSSSSSISSSSLALQPQSKPDRKDAAEEVQKFLNHVAAGEQDEAEAMLKENRDLVLVRGTVTDHAKRTFKNITGFQYAVWALDWQMWRMIREYLPKEAAEEQAKDFVEGSWVAEHGDHADWKKLMEAQQTLIDNWKTWDWKKIDEYWIQQIGGAQLLLPMHVLQEYSQPHRPFHPCPKFDADYSLIRGPLGGVGNLNSVRSVDFTAVTWNLAYIVWLAASPRCSRHIRWAQSTANGLLVLTVTLRSICMPFASCLALECSSEHN